ncbi:hypothetical protein LBMAG53_33750 [Planctomycetota bacterium]|nr:hypothetical protein LBMAG53_33750 [Planctomycetota bacterium]
MASTFGFSAIELMVVISIMLILSGLGVSSVLSTLRRSAVNQAVTAISATNEQAKTLSITGGSMGINCNVAFGVVIEASSRTCGFPFIALTMGKTNDGFATDHRARILIEDTAASPLASSAFPSASSYTHMGSDTGLLVAKGSKRPSMIHRLRSTASIYTVSSGSMVPLDQSSPTAIGWYFQQRSGYLIQPSARSDWPKVATICELGQATAGDKTWSDRWKSKNQADIPGRDWSVRIPNLLPGMTATAADRPFSGVRSGDPIPGLCVVSSDGAYRVGITALANGQLLTRAF